jgi:hypothetical protein
MAAVATDFGNVLIGGVPAVITAILFVARYCARTTVVRAFIVIRHNFSPLFALNFASIEAPANRVALLHFIDKQ